MRCCIPIKYNVNVIKYSNPRTTSSKARCTNRLVSRGHAQNQKRNDKQGTATTGNRATSPSLPTRPSPSPFNKTQKSVPDTHPLVDPPSRKIEPKVTEMENTPGTYATRYDRIHEKKQNIKHTHMTKFETEGAKEPPTRGHGKRHGVYYLPYS